MMPAVDMAHQLPASDTRSTDRFLFAILLMLLAASPAVSLTPEEKPRPVVDPQITVPVGTDKARLIFTFEEILLAQGFRVTRRIFSEALPISIMELLAKGIQVEHPSPSRARYIFELEASPNLVGEMVLRYEPDSQVLVFESAVFDQDSTEAPMDESRFGLITDRLMNGIIDEIERKLR